LTDAVRAEQRPLPSGVQRPAGRALNVILGITIVLLLVITSVAIVWVYRTAKLQQVPQTLADVTIRQLQDQIKKHPSDGAAYLSLAGTYFDTKQYDKALDVIHNLEATGPKGVLLAESTYAEAKIVETRGDTSGAERLYIASLDVTETADARYGLGLLYLGKQSYEQAVTHLARYSALVPDDAGALEKLAKAYEGAGQRAKALKTYQQALAYTPANTQIQAAISRLKGQ
jgi:tetratricopeptide (TPR) repeat protein